MTRARVLLLPLLLPALTLAGEQADRAAKRHQIGMRARDAAPEVVEEIERKAKNEMDPPTRRQIDRNTAEIRQDNAIIKAQLAATLMRLAQITEEQAHIKSDLAQKDMSRVAVLERRFEDAANERKEEQRQDQKRWDTWTAWLRSLAGGIVLTVILGYVRGRKLFKDVTQVKHQTNGMSKRMEDLATEKGYWHGVATGTIQPPDAEQHNGGRNDGRRQETA